MGRFGDSNSGMADDSIAIDSHTDGEMGTWKRIIP